jgi:methionine biosynthesis protein MetW
LKKYRNKAGWPRRIEIIDMVPEGTKNVLDVGCGSGDVGESIRKMYGCRVTGVEKDHEEALMAAGRLDRVLEADIETVDMPFSGDSFDCIIMADVLEHLKEPLKVLKGVIRFLSPEGTVIISLPNIRHISVLYDLVFRGRWEYKDSGLMDRGHLRFFTRRSMRQLFESSGLIVSDVKKVHSIKGAALADFLTAGLLEDFLTAQFVFMLQRKRAEVTPGR